MSDEGRSAMTEAAGGEPDWVYFYYITPTHPLEHAGKDDASAARHPGWKIRAFLEERSSEPFDEQAIQTLVDQADNKTIKPIGFSVEDLRLRYPGYMLFVWREPARTLLNVEFGFDGPPPTKNHSFGAVTQGQLSAGLSFAHRRNTRLNKNGRPLGEAGHEEETFKVAFVTEPPLPNFEGHSERIPDGLLAKLIHNESSTNVGP